MAVCATGGWGQANGSHLQWHGGNIKSSSVKRHYETMHMTRFDGHFPPESATRREKVARLRADYERQIGRVRIFHIQTKR